VLLLMADPEFITRLVNDLVELLVFDKVPETVVVPVMLMLIPPRMAVAEAGMLIGPATLSDPPVPVIDPPLLITSPPAPTLVVRFCDQLALPFIVSERQLPVFPFIVMVCPDCMVTLSFTPGMPPGDQVLLVAQFPEPVLT
jgi:hypothetical protein